jgi:ParB family transcriptional regulator, chromosome partitioning protein
MDEKLGRGLDALIRDIDEQENPDTGITTLPISRIMPNRYQPRKVFAEDKLAELADSIRVKGIIQPIIVTKTDESEYELVAGERRLEAAKLAGLTEVPVIVRSVTEKDQLQLALIENIQRENLNPMEEAGAYQQLVDVFQMSHIQISEIMGKDRATITNALRLLKLDKDIQNMILSGTISAGHARAVLSVDEKHQIGFAKLIAEQAMSVRQAEKKAREFSSEKPLRTPRAPRPDRNPYFNSLEEQLSGILGCKTKIQDNNNKGKIVIEYKDQDEFESLVNKLNRN